MSIVAQKPKLFSSPNLQHFLTLAAILLLGLGLRLWHLESKPLWLDEVLTALFGSGLSYDVIPKEQPFAITTLPDSCNGDRRPAQKLRTTWCDSPVIRRYFFVAYMGG
jgi:hypothetical protein